MNVMPVLAEIRETDGDPPPARRRRACHQFLAVSHDAGRHGASCRSTLGEGPVRLDLARLRPLPRDRHRRARRLVGAVHQFDGHGRARYAGDLRRRRPSCWRRTRISRIRACGCARSRTPISNERVREFRRARRPKALTTGWNAASAGMSTIPPRAIRSGRFRPARRSSQLAGGMALPELRRAAREIHAAGLMSAERRRQGAGRADRGALSRDRRRADGGAADLQSGARRRRRRISRSCRAGGRDRRDALVHEHRRGRPPRRRRRRRPRGRARRACWRCPPATVDLIVGELPGFGRLDAASLFSPMFEFADMAAAVETAEAAARELFEPPPAPPLRRAPGSTAAPSCAGGWRSPKLRSERGPMQDSGAIRIELDTMDGFVSSASIRSSRPVGMAQALSRPGAAGGAGAVAPAVHALLARAGRGGARGDRLRAGRTAPGAGPAARGNRRAGRASLRIDARLPARLALGARAARPSCAKSARRCAQPPPPRRRSPAPAKAISPIPAGSPAPMRGSARPPRRSARTRRRPSIRHSPRCFANATAAVCRAAPRPTR